MSRSTMRRRLQREADLLIDWFLPAVTGAPAPAAVAAEYRAVWRALYPLADAAPPTLVLRDYHVDNLMELPGRAGVAACGLLDFQDALIGSPAYDLVSLVNDARRDISPALRDAMVERYLAAFPALDRESFLAAAAMLSAQRNCKIVGIFTRLMARDGKPVYLQHIPRVWRLLEADLVHPALAPLKVWLDGGHPAGPADCARLRFPAMTARRRPRPVPPTLRARPRIRPQMQRCCWLRVSARGCVPSPGLYPNPCSKSAAGPCWTGPSTRRSRPA